MNTTLLNTAKSDTETLGVQTLSPNVFEPRRLLQALWRHKHLAVLICLAGVGGTSFYTSRLAKAYIGVASVMMENPSLPTSTQPPVKAEANKWHTVLAMSVPVR